MEKYRLMNPILVENKEQTHINKHSRMQIMYTIDTFLKNNRKKKHFTINKDSNFLDAFSDRWITLWMYLSLKCFFPLN